MTTRRWLYVAGAALALLLIGYASGRYVAPDKIVTVDKVVTVDRVVTVDKVRTEVQQAKAVEVQHDVRYVRVREKRPDGTTTDTTTRVDLSKEHANDLIHVDFAKEATTERLVYQDREHVKLVERARPNWGAAALPGLDLAARRLVVGGSIERRVLGPLFAGVWGNSAGLAGITVRLEF